MVASITPNPGSHPGSRVRFFASTTLFVLLLSFVAVPASASCTGAEGVSACTTEFDYTHVDQTCQEPGSYSFGYTGVYVAALNLATVQAFGYRECFTGSDGQSVGHEFAGVYVGVVGVGASAGYADHHYLGASWCQVYANLALGVTNPSTGQPCPVSPPSMPWGNILP